MRIKIIAVNALIVVICGLLSFLLVRSSLMATTRNQDQLVAEAKRNAHGAAARLQLDGLRAERWLTSKAAEQMTLEAFEGATPSARGDAATKRSDDIVSTAKSMSLFEGSVPTFVAIVDRTGKIVGRNGSALARGDDLAAPHPGLTATLASAQPGSDVWFNKDRFLASYVPIFRGRELAGAIVIGRPLNDELSRVSDATTGRPLLLVVASKDVPEIVGKSTATNAALDDAVGKGAKEAIVSAITKGQSGVAVNSDLLIATSSLEGIGDGKRAALVVAAPASLLENVSTIPAMTLAGTAVGVLLVIVAGWLLGNYITRPINTLEEGLLAILNGQSDKRFELDHAELGGLGFRIDQLLNQLMGVEEDNTDADGRVSQAPSAARFTDAMAVDDKRMEGDGTLDPEAVSRLANEAPPQYYARVYREYIEAKKSLGEPTDHITEQAFVSRIQSMEKDASDKYGRPVRYQVQAKAKEVTLLAIPLP